MMGRQSHNTGIRAVPAPGSVTIDGDLSDWDLSGRIWSFADMAIRDRYSAQTAAMWDKDYLYLAVKFTDPNPLVNTINPVFDPESGWKGDSLQLRVLTDWPQWLTMWHFAGENRSMLHHAMWKDAENSRNGTDVSLYVGEPGATQLGKGVEMAFKIMPDGRGYIQEIRLPWSLLYKKVPSIAPGLTFRMGVEFFWGAAGDSVWPVHRYADNLQPGETSREFFWTAKKAWGDVTLVPDGKVEQLSYIPDVGRLEGTIPVRATIPASAKEFTVVIESASGERVRNLGAQLNPELYSLEIKGAQRLVQVLWDGADDAGKIVAPGEYRVRGLSHEGLGADYVMSFFNPGTPPWETGVKGSWGADHGAPQYAAASGDWAIIGWLFAEGGHGIVAIGPDGLKRWGEKRGVAALAADKKSVYFISSSWHAAGNLCRLNLGDGAYKPFVLDGKPRPFELTLGEIFGTDVTASVGEVTGLASSGDVLAMTLSGGRVVLLDPNSAAVLKNFAVPAPSAVAYGPHGELYVVTEGQLARVDVTTGAVQLIATPGLKLAASDSSEISQDHSVTEIAATSKKAKPHQVALAVDPQGMIGIYDGGVDQHVKFFTPAGKFSYAVGMKGGRSIRGTFNKQAMSRVSAIAVDAKGQVWATENWEFPRRVSVWGRDGELVRDYIGNTGYAGTGAYLHDEDPSLAYYGPVEMKLDLKKRTWDVTRVLWVPGPGEHFDIPTTSHTHPHRFSSVVNGRKREFLFSPPYRNSHPYVLFMEGIDGWRPVAAIGILGQISGELESRDATVIAQPSGEFAGRNAYDGYFWNDTNGDGKIQASEVTIVPAEKPVAVGARGTAPIPLGSSWGTRMSPEDRSFFVNGPARYVPLRHTEEGAPVYGPESIRRFNTLGAGNGDYVPVPGEDSVIALRWESTFGSKGLYALDAKTGRPNWSYPNPFPGVHGSHRAPMPQPGLLIGPLKILGVAELPPSAGGHVFGLRGNLGQDFYFTTDGLMIGTIFQDGRLPTMALPDKEEQLFGAPMESYGGGGEPFTGWFGSHADGKLRLISGMPRQAAMILEVNGFDRIRRFDAPRVNVSEKVLAEAAVANVERAAAAAKNAEKKTVISRSMIAPAIDGKGSGWKDVPSFEVKSPASGFKAKAQLAYDATHLYLAIDVEDPSPWKNEGVDFTRLFKTGDAVDIQLSSGEGDASKRDQPAAGDLRVVFALLNRKPAAVLMQPVNPTAAKTARKIYTSPVGDKIFDEVRILPEAKLAVTTKSRSYRLEASLPLASLGLKPEAGREIRGDIGFISSDETGRINTARTYWSNPTTNLVNDEPLEAWLAPKAWGVFTWGK